VKMRREEVVRARMAADAEQELAVQRAGDLEAARREARQKVDAKEMQEADMMERWRAVEAQKQAREAEGGKYRAEMAALKAAEKIELHNARHSRGDEMAKLAAIRRAAKEAEKKKAQQEKEEVEERRLKELEEKVKKRREAKAMVARAAASEMARKQEVVWTHKQETLARAREQVDLLEHRLQRLDSPSASQIQHLETQKRNLSIFIKQEAAAKHAYDELKRKTYESHDKFAKVAEPSS